MWTMPVLTNVTILWRQMTLLPGGQLVDAWVLFKDPDGRGDRLYDVWIKMA